MKAAPRREAPLLPKMVDWLQSKMVLITVAVQGEIAEALSALKERAPLVGAIEVLLKLIMVMVVVSAQEMIGAQLMKMMTTTSLQEVVSLPKKFGGIYQSVCIYMDMFIDMLMEHKKKRVTGMDKHFSFMILRIEFCNIPSIRFYFFPFMGVE